MSSFYLNCNLSSSNIINPHIDLEGEWEVALVDIFAPKPTVVKQLKTIVAPITTTNTTTWYNKPRFLSTLSLGKNGIFCYYYIDIRPFGLMYNTRINDENFKVRRAWFKYKYGNNSRYRIQSNDFDKWNNHIKNSGFSEKNGIWIPINNTSLVSTFEKNSSTVLSTQELIDLINIDINPKTTLVTDYLRLRYRDTDGAIRIKLPHILQCLCYHLIMII